MTDLVNNHTESLEQARFTTENIIQTLEKTAAIAKSWTEMLTVSSIAGDWALRIIMPPSALVLGSYGLPPSLARNAALFFGGLTLAEVIVWARHYGFDWNEVDDDAETPSSVTQLARGVLGLLATTPVDIEIELG
jgi:hypothetical protein